MIIASPAFAQVSLVCTNPTNVAYGLTNAGEIYEINSTTAATIRVIKDATYAGQPASNANGMGFNVFNTKFYYFKRNVTAGNQQFVSFAPATNTVSILAKSTATDDIHTGCVSYDGSGYFTVDIQGTLHYYDIANNKWTYITSKLVDQDGNDVTSIIKTQSAGDMAIDGSGNMWLLTSSNTNYGLYKFPANLPTVPMAQVTVVRWISPTAVTPTGNSFAGIAFKPNGQILMSTRGDNKLYLLQTSSLMTFVGNLTTPDVGNDLTACSFPAGILPVTWKKLEATVQNNNQVVLNWEILTEYENKGFSIQHSINGKDWEDIAFVVAKNNYDAIDRYSYTDVNNLNGQQYYRIKQIDLDNKFSYSEVVSVNLKNDNQAIAIWPNPSTDQVHVASNTAGTSVFARAQVFDLSGRMLMQVSMQANKNMINVAKLPTGTYLVKVFAENGASYTQKIVKQ